MSPPPETARFRFGLALFFVLMECTSLWKVDAVEAAPGAVVGFDRFP